MRKHDFKSSLPVWKIHPQEMKGNYFFDGQVYMTVGVQEELTFEEILTIIGSVKDEVKRHNGADYLFVFTHKDRKIFVIDNLNQDMKKSSSKEFIRENNYFTIMFAEEY